MINRLIACLALIISVFASASNDADAYQKQSQLELSGNSSGYSFAVPDDVYIESFYKDLRDVRIINATGDFVPMRLFLTIDEVKHEYTKTSLPTFKLNQTILSSTNSKQVRTTRQGTKEDYTVTTSKSLQHYLKANEIVKENQILIDADVLDGQRIENLEIDWHYQTKGNRLFYVNLSGSNDLSRWINIKTRQRLAEINTGSKTLLENTIAINNKAYAYYKLTFVDDIFPEVTRVQAKFVNQTIEKSMKRRAIDNYSLIMENALEFDTGGMYSVESFKLSFNQNNTITDVQLYSRNNTNKKWHYAGTGTIYSMESDGITFNQDTVNIRRSNDRFWKIQFDQNINNKSLKKIEMNWRNHQIEFLAQGQAPFTMVYAHPGKIIRASGQWYNKIPRELRDKMFSSQVVITETNNTAVKRVVTTNQATNQNSDYAKWIFWSILAIVLLILIIMAYKLVQDSAGD